MRSFDRCVEVVRVESTQRSGVSTCRVRAAGGVLHTLRFLPVVASKTVSDASFGSTPRPGDVLRVRTGSSEDPVPFLYPASAKSPDPGRRYHNAATMCREYGIHAAHEVARRVADDRELADPAHWERYPAEFMDAVCMVQHPGSASLVTAVLRLVPEADAGLRACIVAMHCVAQRVARTGDTVFAAQAVATDARRYLGQTLERPAEVARVSDLDAMDRDFWQPTPPCWATEYAENGRRRYVVMFHADRAARAPHVPSGRVMCLASTFRRERYILKWFSPQPQEALGPATPTTTEDTPMDEPSTDDILTEIHRFEAEQGCSLDATQVRAVCAAFEFSPFVIHGGPGTGKTTIVRCIVHCARRARRMTCTLLAPTGKAARRLAACTGEDASTLHHFFYARRSSAAAAAADVTDVFVLDEASMISTDTMYEFLRCVPSDVNIILVGDPFQLPPVEHGGVLADALCMPWIESVRLTTTHRQAADSTGIAKIARGFEGAGDANIVIKAIRGVPPMTPATPWGPGVLYVACEPSDGIRVLWEHLRTLAPEQVYASQVLCPGRKTAMGIAAINACEDVCAVYREAARVVLGGDGDADGGGADGLVRYDKIMFTRNKDPVCNGDVYVVTDVAGGSAHMVSAESAQVRGAFPISRRRHATGPQVPLEGFPAERAFAITVHKSQGCEFDTVYLMMDLAFGGMLLDRKLVYTAVTRAKRLLVIIGSPAALAECFEREHRPRATLLGVVAADHRAHARVTRLKIYCAGDAAAMRTRCAV